MRRKERTPSYVAEFPLRTTRRDERELPVRLDAARQVYNASLGEAFRRLDLMRESLEWQRARTMPRGKARTEAFKAAILRFSFKSGEIQKFSEGCRDTCWIGDHLGSHDTQTTSLRAFRAVEQYAFGKRGQGKIGSREHRYEALCRLRNRGTCLAWSSLGLCSLRSDSRGRHDPERIKDVLEIQCVHKQLELESSR